MAELVVPDFDGIDTADAVLTRLRLLREQELIDLLDAVVVVNSAGGGIQIKRSVNVAAMGAVTGLGTGALVATPAGVFGLDPIGGMALEGMAGALGGRLSDCGIDDDFIREVGDTIAPGASALPVLVAKATADKVVAEIREHRPRVLRISLPNEQEGALRETPAEAV